MRHERVTIKPKLEQAIIVALEQVRNEMIRLYSGGDIGTISVHCGTAQIRVKAAPERNLEPVQFEK